MKNSCIEWLTNAWIQTLPTRYRFDERLLFLIIQMQMHKPSLQLNCAKICPCPHNQFVCGAHGIFHGKKISGWNKVGTIAHRTNAEQTTLPAFDRIPTQRNVFGQVGLLQHFGTFFSQRDWHKKLTWIAFPVDIVSVHWCSGSAPLRGKCHPCLLCNRRNVEIQHGAGRNLRMFHVIMNQACQLRFQNVKAFISAPVRTER